MSMRTLVATVSWLVWLVNTQSFPTGQSVTTRKRLLWEPLDVATLCELGERVWAYPPDDDPDGGMPWWD